MLLSSLLSFGQVLISSSLRNCRNLLPRKGRKRTLWQIQDLVVHRFTMDSEKKKRQIIQVLNLCSLRSFFVAYRSVSLQLVDMFRTLSSVFKYSSRQLNRPACSSSSATNYEHQAIDCVLFYIFSQCYLYNYHLQLV